MISDYRCFYCFARAFEKLLEKENMSVESKNNFTRELAELYAKTKDNFSAPEFSRELHALLRPYTNNSDPYKEAKRKSNDLALSMYPSLK
jgi:damage-control phosphatase, subfamily I